MRGIRTVLAFAVLACAVSGAAKAADSGTAAEARAMLERAVAELKVDEAKALSEFSSGQNGFKDRDLYVFCIGPDGKTDAHPDPARIGIDAKALKDVNGKLFLVEMLAVAEEGKFSEVSYMQPKLGSTEPVAKSSFVTKVGRQVCGVGYYK